MSTLSPFFPSIVSTTAGGVEPGIRAERALQAIRDEQFYILSDESWHKIANTRLEDIRLRQNPRLIPPAL